MLPQLDFSHYTSQLFWLLVCCIMLVFVMKRVFIPRMNAIIQGRDDAISRDEAKVLELENEHNEIERRIATVKSDAISEEREQMVAVEHQKEQTLLKQLDVIKCEHNDVMRQYRIRCEAEIRKIQSEPQGMDTLVQAAMARLGGGQ